jgi:hypothetical protein
MRRFEISALCLLSVGLGTACSSDDNSGSPGSGTTALTAPPAGKGLQIRQAFPDLAAGREVHYCNYFVLPTEHAIDVERFEHTYTSGGHHVILYPTRLKAADVQNQLDVFDCDERAPSRGDIGFGYVGGGTKNELVYPKGVAWHFEAGDVVILESHMLNLGKEPLDVDYRVNLWYATEPVTDHVGTIFFYDNNIYIPENGSFTAKMDCGIPRDISVLFLAPHMHVRGTHFESRLIGPNRPSPIPLVGTDDWSSIEPTIYRPPLELKTGDRVQYSCDYVNRDSFPVVEGPSKTDNEMCLMVGGYYPKIDFPFEFCSSPGSGPQFNGTKKCGEVVTCFTNAKDPIAAEKCRVDVCPGSNRAFNDFFGCVAQKCFFAGKCTGPATDPKCNDCAIQECASELSTCSQATCQ